MPESAETRGMSWMRSTFGRPGDQVAPLVLGTMLIAAGVVLLIDRVRTEGVHVLWPLLLVVVGVAQIGTGPLEGRDEAWWLVGIGSWLLMKTLTPVLLHQAVALTIVAGGVVTWRRALAPHAAATTLEDSHGH